MPKAFHCGHRCDTTTSFLICKFGFCQYPSEQVVVDVVVDDVVEVGGNELHDTIDRVALGYGVNVAEVADGIALGYGVNVAEVADGIALGYGVNVAEVVVTVEVEVDVTVLDAKGSPLRAQVWQERWQIHQAFAALLLKAALARIAMFAVKVDDVVAMLVNTVEQRSDQGVLDDWVFVCSTVNMVVGVDVMASKGQDWHLVIVVVEAVVFLEVDDDV
eukprot:5790580-Amphidinium_carterae.1